MISGGRAIRAVLSAAVLIGASGGILRAQSDELEGSGFNWAAALRQSGLFLGIQHSFRLATEPGSREALKGPFFQDYFDSVRAIKSWDDGDPVIVNYVGHPMMGAVSGFIQIQNDPRGRTQQFGMNSDYWRSRMKAMAWSAAYSAQFEIGPASEASIGNVGIGPARTGTVDLVITPIAGLGWTVAEDAVDRYVVSSLERRFENRAARLVFRSFLNPSRSFSNMLRGKVPWFRDGRGGARLR